MGKGLAVVGILEERDEGRGVGVAADGDEVPVLLRAQQGRGERPGHEEATAHPVQGLADEGALAPGWTVSRATDYLWVGCSVQVWDLLVVDRGWSATQASKSLRRGLSRALLR